MKYIKTFEEKITLDLDKEDIESLMSSALEKNKFNLIKDLLDNKVDPNYLINGYPLFLHYVAYNKKDINFDIIHLLIDRGADVNFEVGGYNLISEVVSMYNKKESNNSDFLNLIRILIKEGADLLIVLDEDYPNTFEFIENYIEIKRFSKLMAIQLINILKEECPEQYAEYLEKKEIDSATSKYNI